MRQLGRCVAYRDHDTTRNGCPCGKSWMSYRPCLTSEQVAGWLLTFGKMEWKVDDLWVGRGR